MSTTLHFTVFTERGQGSLMGRLETALSPVGITGFLSGVVDPYLRQRARARFRSEGDDASGKWAELAEATGRIRESQGFQAFHPINRRTGSLENFITQGRGAISTTGDIPTLTLPGREPAGEMKEKFETAQMGGDSFRSGNRPAPPRPVLAVSERDLLFVTAELAFYVRSARRGAR